MTSYEVTKHLQTFLDATGPDRALVRYLFVVAKGYDAISAELLEILQAKSRTLFSAKQQLCQDKFTELRRQAEAFPLGQIFHETIELQRIVKQLLEAFEGDESHYFSDMHRQVASFYSIFERLVRNPSKELFGTLLPEAGQLYAVVVSARQFFTTMRGALQHQAPATPGLTRLSILFASPQDYRAVLRRLTALQDGYAELCSLVGVSVEEQPLRVVKIEAGNLWICVEGEQRIVRLYTALIQRFALFWFNRNATGEAEAAPADRITATQSLVNLTDELERAGIMEVTPDAARIKETALALRKTLMDLLDGEASIRINEKPIEGTAVSEETPVEAVKPAAQAPLKPAPPKLDIHRLAQEIAFAAAR